MGIFIHALDAESGEILWTNSGDGTNYTVQPHGAPSFAAVVPQGHLAISGENLVVPGGRSTPAVFELATEVVAQAITLGQQAFGAGSLLSGLAPQLLELAFELELGFQLELELRA